MYYMKQMKKYIECEFKMITMKRYRATKYKKN